MHLLGAECGSSEFESGVLCASLCLAAVSKILIHYLYSNSDPVFPESFGWGPVSFCNIFEGSSLMFVSFYLISSHEKIIKKMFKHFFWCLNLAKFSKLTAIFTPWSGSSDSMWIHNSDPDPLPSWKINFALMLCVRRGWPACGCRSWRCLTQEHSIMGSQIQNFIQDGLNVEISSKGIFLLYMPTKPRESQVKRVHVSGPVKGLCGRCFICLRPPPLLWPHTPPLHTVYNILIHTGKGGWGGRS